MAVVGEAEVIIRAITRNVKNDIRKGFAGVDKDSEIAGNRAGAGFARGFRRANKPGGLFSPQFLAQADAAQARFTSLVRTGNTLTTALVGVAGALGSIVGGLGALIGVLGAATPGVVALATSFSALAQGAIVAKTAFSGVTKALQAGLKSTKAAAKDNKALANAEERLQRAREAKALLYLEVSFRQEEAQKDLIEAQYQYNDALRETKEQLQQTRFEAEEAALGEQSAALALARARDNLAKTADLPAGSRARQQALLEFQEAELKYRQAIDRNRDSKEALAKDRQTASRSITAAQRAFEAAKRNVDPTQVGGQAFQDEKALAAASREVADAEKAVADAKKGSTAQANAYSEAMAGLSKEAQAFVKYLISIRGEFSKLKAAAGEKLFPQLQSAIQNLIDKLLPRLVPLFRETGGVLGSIAKELSSVITKSDNLDKLERIWKTNDKALKNFGSATGNLYSSLLSIGDAARPLTLRFSNWVKELTKSWKETLEVKNKSGELTKTLNTAGDILAQLGRIFRNIFGSFGQIIKANVGPGSGGQMLLDYFEQGTKRFQGMLTVGNREGGGLKEFFAQSALSFKALLGLITNIIAELVKLGAAEGTRKFIGSLNRVVDIFGEIAQNVANTGALETFGKLLEEAALAIKNLTQGAGIRIFFQTLTTAVQGVNKLLSNDFVQALLTAGGAIFGFLTAIGLLTDAFKFLGFTAIGKTEKALNLFGKSLAGIGASTTTWNGYIKGADSSLGLFAKKTDGVRLSIDKFGSGAGSKIDNVLSKIPLLGKRIPPVGALLGPTAIAIGVIAGAAVILYNVWKNSEALRTSIEAFVNAIKTVFAGALEDINKALASVFGEGTGLKEVFQAIGDFLSVTLIPILTGAFSAAIGAVSGAITGLIQAVGAVIDIFEFFWKLLKTIFKSVGALLKGDFKGAVKIFTSGLSDAFGSLVSAFKRIALAIVSPIVGIFNALIRAWNATAGKFNVKIPDWIPKQFGGGKTFSFQTLKEIDVTKALGLAAPARYAANEGRDSNFTYGMAKGGTVFPQRGGSLITIAEAGRPERVEPLDTNGLSQGDKAILSAVNNSNGVVINVYPSAGMDERDLAAKVSRQLALQMRTGIA